MYLAIHPLPPFPPPAGAPIGRNIVAADRQFVHMLTKPMRCWGTGSATGRAVHDADKQLVQFFIDHDDGVEHNETFAAGIVAATNANQVEFDYQTGGDRGMTVFSFPSPEVQQWSCSTLVELCLKRNSLTTLPEEFFDMVNLEKLDLSCNLLWMLGPNIKKMPKLTKLHLDNNCLEGLPDELENLALLEDFTCKANPIVYPPQSVVSGGLGAIQGFFKDARKRGTSANTDLKVLVLGLSEAGKTSLINGILDGNSRLQRRGDRTVGIEQRSWSFPRDDPAWATAESPFGQVYHFSPERFGDRFFDLKFESPTDVTLMIPADKFRYMHVDNENEEEVPQNMPVSRSVTNITWDAAARTFTGDMVFSPYKIRVGYRGEDVEKLRFDIVFAEDFESMIDGSALEFYASASDQPGVDDPTNSWQTGAADNQAYEREKHYLQEVHLKMFDFAGQQEYYATHHIFLTERALYILAFDLSKYSTATFHDQVLFWLETIQDRIPDAKLVICGTHADLLDPAIAKQKCEKIAKTLLNRQGRARKHLNKRLDALRKRKDVIDEVKTATAIVEIASRAWPATKIKGLHERAKKLMHQDMEPAVEELTADEEEILKLLRAKKAADKTFEAEEKTLNGIVTKIGQQTSKLLKLPDKVYAVSNAEGLRGMGLLVDHLKVAAIDRASFPEMDEQIPTTYLDVRRLIRQLRLETKYWYMPTPAFLAKLSADLSNDDRMVSTDEIERAMAFMHTLGEVLHYKKGKIDVVFLKVAYLIDAFKLVIRHDHAESTVYRDDLDGVTMSKRVFEHFKKMLLGAGELSISMLERLWAPPAPDGLGLTRSSDPERFFSLVELLQDFEIVAAVKRDQDGRPTEFIVPEFEPQDLAANCWSAGCPVGEMQVERWFQFERAPPRGIMQRLQVKVCSRACPNNAVFSKEALSLQIWNCKMFCRIAQGNNAGERNSSGIVLLLRGQDKNAVWRTLITMVDLIRKLLEDWPGHPVNEYVVYAPAEATPQYMELSRLMNEREAGSTMFALPKSNVSVKLSTVLPPKEVVAWKEVDAKTFVMEEDSDDDLDLDDHLANAKVQSCTSLVEQFRERATLWIALFHDADSKPLAEMLFAQLTSEGIPCWIDSYSGARGTVYSRILDGLFTAGLVCPLITKTFQTDKTNKQMLQLAGKEAKYIVPIICEPGQVELEPWLVEVVRKGAPDFASGANPTIRFDGGMDLATMRAQVDALGKIAVGLCGVKPLLHTIDTGGIRRERRKSFSRDKEPSPTAAATAAKSELDERSFVQKLFADEFRFKADFVATYEKALNESFKKLFDNPEDPSNLLMYNTSESLESAGISEGPHRQRILLWIKQAETNSHGGIVAFNMPNAVKPVQSKIFISYSSKDSQDLFQHLVSVLSITGREIFEPTKDLHNPSKVEMRENVAASDLILVIVSPSYLESEYCRVELEEARRSKKTVLPVYDGDSFVQKTALEWKTRGDDLAEFLYSKNLIKVKDVQDQKHATELLLQKLEYEGK